MVMARPWPTESFQCCKFVLPEAMLISPKLLYSKATIILKYLSAKSETKLTNMRYAYRSKPSEVIGMNANLPDCSVTSARLRLSLYEWKYDIVFVPYFPKLVGAKIKDRYMYPPLSITKVVQMRCPARGKESAQLFVLEWQLIIAELFVNEITYVSQLFRG